MTNEENFLLSYLLENWKKYNLVFKNIARVKPERFEDLMQGFLLALLAKPNDGKGIDNPRGYLTTSFRNYYIDRQRMRKRREDKILCYGLYPDEAFFLSESEDPLLILISNEEKELILNRLGKLDKKYRDALWLHIGQGVSFSECAEQFSVPIGTVQSRTNRGLVEIREEYGLLL